MKDWIRLRFYERNTYEKKDLSEVFHNHSPRIIGVPDRDEIYDLKTMLRGLSITQYAMEIVRFRHIDLREGGRGLDISYGYAIEMNDFWAVFPMLGPVWLTSVLADKEGAEHEIKGLGIEHRMVELNSYDYDKDEFMQYVQRHEHTFRKEYEYLSLEESIDVQIYDKGVPKELQPYFDNEIEKIEDKIWGKDYPHAIRDMRALIEDLLRFILQKKKIQFDDSDTLHELKAKIVQNKLIERRLDRNLSRQDRHFSNDKFFVHLLLPITGRI